MSRSISFFNSEKADNDNNDDNDDDNDDEDNNNDNNDDDNNDNDVDSHDDNDGDKNDDEDNNDDNNDEDNNNKDNNDNDYDSHDDNDGDKNDDDNDDEDDDAAVTFTESILSRKKPNRFGSFGPFFNLDQALILNEDEQETPGISSPPSLHPWPLPRASPTTRRLFFSSLSGKRLFSFFGELDRYQIGWRRKSTRADVIAIACTNLSYKLSHLLR